ncbi:MAG: aminomethyl-transferring glycine dehydrogenase subunit GcvPB [Oscillospiraceae bacterium]|nr:aminomethyl-transferring glycine dehydrogenase subunit GcvPB [Oscillospiraceae bacterium]
MSELIFSKSRPGRRCTVIPKCDVPKADIPHELLRETAPGLPEIAEVDLVRHYTNLSRRAFGVDNGFYPLGSCTMKYNPKVNEEAAALRSFTGIHPLQPPESVQGALQVMGVLSDCLREITGMNAISLQPAAGAHGEFAALVMIKAYLLDHGQPDRTKLIVPDSAHGTNPASAAMCGFEVVNIPSTADGLVDLDALKSAVGDDTAALMLTNPNTVGKFDTNIGEIADIVHGAGGLLYYDGANLNAIMGIARPGDMGFDAIHLNLHKTFSTPHGGGGPGSGPVGCNAKLAPYLPSPAVTVKDGGYAFTSPEKSVGMLKSFYGNFLVCVKALAYILTLGADGLREASENAVLNANYMQENLRGAYDVPFPGHCMHEFVLSLELLKKETGVTAADIAKGLIDRGVHPPTMYFPLIVHEALMLEPTETESRETLDHAIAALKELRQMAAESPQALHDAPVTTPVGRPDETAAVRNPVLRA